MIALSYAKNKFWVNDFALMIHLYSVLLCRLHNIFSIFADFLPSSWRWSQDRLNYRSIRVMNYGIFEQMKINVMDKIDRRRPHTNEGVPGF